MCSHASIHKHIITYLNSTVEKGDLNLQKGKKKIHNSILDGFDKLGNRFLPQNEIIIVINTGNLIFCMWIVNDVLWSLYSSSSKYKLKNKSNTNVISKRERERKKV